MPTAIVVGGTGQTGPLVVQGLLDRGYDVTILHTGQHERSDLPDVPHIHADPHFLESLQEALESKRYDLAVCMYGRARLVGEVLAGKAQRLISISGIAYAWATPNDPRWGPFGTTVASEDSPFLEDGAVDKLGAMVFATERALLTRHAAGEYAVTILRYPEVFGPHSPVGRDWSIIRRILDRRPHFGVADGGLRLGSRVFRDNAAHAVLLAVDQPHIAAGQVYNVADDPPLLSTGQRIEFFGKVLGHQMELVSLPIDVVARLYGLFGYHNIIDASKIRRELGYQDVVTPEDALRTTVRWWSEHQPERGGQLEARFVDRFDYDLEDQLIEAYRDAVSALLEMAPEPLEPIHPFRHPKTLGAAFDVDRSKAIMATKTTAQRSDAKLRYPYNLAV